MINSYNFKEENIDYEIRNAKEYIIANSNNNIDFSTMSCDEILDLRMEIVTNKLKETKQNMNRRRFWGHANMGTKECS